MKNPIVTIEVKSFGTITVELFPQKAPETVNNFVTLINNKFYDGLTFHRIIKGFMIQGGDPIGNGTGGPGYNIKGEFAYNGFKGNDIKHLRGVISMARRAFPYDSAGSQFFIMHEDASSLDGQYAAFGKVLEGIEVVDKIASVKCHPFDNSKPVDPPVIGKITVETFGVSYPAPKKI